MDKTSPILIVDDFPMIRTIVVQLLGESGYMNLKEAEDGSQAWAMINEAHRSGRDFGLVLLDWNMPRVSGIELIEKCRSIEAFKDLPIIVDA